MAQELSAEDIAGVRDVITNSVLASIDFYEISARRSEVQHRDANDGRVTVQVQQRIGEGTFGVRLNAHAVLPEGEASATVVGEYELQNDITPAKRHLQHFANEVAVMTVYPYLREAIATVTAKVFGEPVHLPIVQRGHVSLEVDEEPPLA